MSDQIQAQYDELQQVASQFANQSQAIQEMIQQVSSSFEQLRGGGWIGMGADAFFDEMESLVFPASNRLQQALEEAGEATNQVAQTVKRAEQQASALFRLR